MKPDTAFGSIDGHWEIRQALENVRDQVSKGHQLDERRYILNVVRGPRGRIADVRIGEREARIISWAIELALENMD